MNFKNIKLDFLTSQVLWVRKKNLVVFLQDSYRGQSQGTVVENLLFFREAVVFPNKGKYEMSLNHLMRRKGFIEGLSTLKGITDVGVEIKPENNQQ